MFKKTADLVTGGTPYVLGDHALCCESGGERISRHNAWRDALFDTAVAVVMTEAATTPGFALDNAFGNKRRTAGPIVDL